MYPSRITRSGRLPVEIKTAHDLPPKAEALAEASISNPSVSQAAETIANAVPKLLRKAAAVRAEKHMFQNGTRWNGKWEECLEGRRPDVTQGEKVKSLTNLSSTNIKRLFAELSLDDSGERIALNAKERDFFNNFLTKKFYATHFTNSQVRAEGGIPKLLSLENLRRQNISHNQGAHSTDLRQWGNGDYVFLSLECGDAPKKSASRFGSTRLRYDLNQPQFTHAWASLNDAFGYPNKNLENRLPGLENDDYAKLSESKFVDHYKSKDFYFSGSQILDGIALSTIHAARGLSQAGRDKILSARTDDEIDSVINGLFRPELKVPRFLVTKHFTESTGHPIFRKGV